jgi:hypothetical protein
MSNFGRKKPGTRPGSGPHVYGVTCRRGLVYLVGVGVACLTGSVVPEATDFWYGIHSA